MSALHSIRQNFGRCLVIAIPYVWLLFFFFVPFLILLNISFMDIEGMSTFRPFSGLVSYVDGVLGFNIKLGNYFLLAQDQLYFFTYLNSLKYAALTTAICLLIGYPFAYFMARAKATFRLILVMLVMLPFWTSFLLRIYAWKGILATNGMANHLLISLGMIDAPLHMMNTSFSLLLGMVYAYLPFMIFPLYVNLSKIDDRFVEAAADLGATPWSAFWNVTVPLSKSGIIAGSMLVFIPCIGEFVIPELLGGPDTLMIGRVLWDEFFSNNDWPMASTVTVVVMLFILVPMAFFNKYQAYQEPESR